MSALSELVRIRDFDRRQAAVLAKLGCADSAKDYADSAERLTAEIRIAHVDAHKRLTPMISHHRRTGKLQ